MSSFRVLLSFLSNRAVFLLIIGAVSMKPALSAELTVQRWHGHQVLRLSGPIDEGTADKFEQIRTQVSPLPHGLPVLLLDSPGGLVSEALKISKIFDLHPFHTVVPNGAKCASACASIVFIAGRLRTVESVGLLGQHSCSKGGVPDEECNEILSMHAVEHGVSHGSIKAFVTYVAPDDILWFSREDAEGWGLTKYPGEDLSGFEKSEPRVLKMLTGSMPEAQSAWRIDFREDGYEAFSRTVSDVESEMQINLFCNESLKGRLFLAMEVNGPSATIANAVLSVSVQTEEASWVDKKPVIWQKDEGLSEIVTEIPSNQIKQFLTKSDRLSFGVGLQKPYQPMTATTSLRDSRKVLLFAANHCTSGTTVENAAPLK